MNQLLQICKLIKQKCDLCITRLHHAVRFGADNEGLISTYGTTEDKQQLVSVKLLSVNLM